ncbi:MAG: HlyC/CorC family transporter [Bacteroidales bacterium]|jgi:putative hemolysin|nr:HlyC/CorC family transporter [Bacteroidales bacterium]
MEIIIILLLILFNGILSLTETALTASRRLKMETLDKQEKPSTRRALSLMEKPLHSLSAIQIGITLIGILTGVYSGDTVARQLEHVFANHPTIMPYAGAIAKTLVVLAITYLTIVFGELLPKRIAMTRPEKILRAMSKFLQTLDKICTPFSWLLSKSVDLVLKLFGVKEKKESGITEEEILAAIEKGTNEGEIQEVEQDIVERVFDLGDRDIESMMTYRNELVCIDINDDKQQVLKTMLEDMHSFYPVIDESLDNLQGVIALPDLIASLQQEHFDIRPHIHEAQYFPESSTAYNVLERFRTSKQYYGFVMDEFGLIQGMVTAIDFTEALIGKISAVKADEETIIQQDDETWIVDGQYPFYDFLAHFEQEDIFPENDYNTLSGLLLEMAQHIPTEGEHILWQDFNFEISKMDGARIDKVIVKRNNTHSTDEQP